MAVSFFQKRKKALLSSLCGLGILIAFLVKVKDQEEEPSTLASSAILDILALIFNLTVFGILTWRHKREQDEQQRSIYKFTKAESHEPLVSNDDNGTPSPSHDLGGQANPGYENDDNVFTPGPTERVPERSGTTTITPNAGYQSVFPSPISQANPNYVPVTGISTNTGSSFQSFHTGSTIRNESINTDNLDQSLQNTAYITDSTAQRMGPGKVSNKKSDEPYIKFTKSNDNPISQTASLPVDAAQVAPVIISDDSDSEVEDSYRPNETGAYADILVKDSTPNATLSSVKRHTTMEVNKNQLANDSYVAIEGDAPKAYVFAKDPAPNQNENENRKIERQESIVKNNAYKK